jgi:hypothetical protein
MPLKTLNYVDKTTGRCIGVCFSLSGTDEPVYKNVQSYSYLSLRDRHYDENPWDKMGLDRDYTRKEKIQHTSNRIVGLVKRLAGKALVTTSLLTLTSCASLGFDESGRKDLYHELRNFPNDLMEKTRGIHLYDGKE